MADEQKGAERARMTEDELSQLYGAHHAALLHFVSRMTGDASFAEDVVQDTFLRARSATVSFVDERAAFAWLCQVARRLVIDEMRHRNVVKMEPLDDSDLGDPQTPSAESEVLEGQVDSVTEIAISRLPTRQRSALLLSAEGFDGQEIAQKIGVSHGAARVLLHRARSAARDGIAISPAAEEHQKLDAPYVPGDIVWFFRLLRGTLSGPLTVVKGPGRRPYRYECLVRREDGTTVDIDAADLWRDTPEVREMAAAKAQSYACLREWSDAGKRDGYLSLEYDHKTIEMRETRERANDLVAEMSKRHPYGHVLYHGKKFVGRPGKLRRYEEIPATTS